MAYHAGVTPEAELAHLLRPAGGGVHLVSTGREAQLALQARLYGASSPDEIDARWRASLARIRTARVVVLAVPSDVGAGFLRGANMGPRGIRETRLAEAPDLAARYEADGVVDIGDVFVVPQLLHDEMLSATQRERSLAALYPTLDSSARASLPVSPLSITERALDLVFALNPRAKLFVMGGDHSVAWPVSSALARAHRAASGELAILQFDAHTDLLEERLGVRYCFATWSFHASRLLATPAHMVQVGVRASRFDRGHWLRETGVVQFWADECNAAPDAAIERVLDALARTGAKKLYVSNDIDGTDEAFADATGTPEPGGLTPEFVETLIRRAGERFEIVAGDLMEVAPPLARRADGAGRTLATATRYMRATFEGLLR